MSSQPPGSNVYPFTPRPRQRSDQRIKPFLGPITTALSATHWSTLLALDLFSQKIRYRTAVGAPWQDFTEEHRTQLESYLTTVLGIDTANSGLISRVVYALALANQFDPLLDYLNSLSWDGVHRLPTWAEDFLGVAPSPPSPELPIRYTQLMPLKWMVSAVARAYEPGCKVDNVLVLEGKQGLRKSTALEVLGGPFYLGHLPQITRGREAAEIIRGRWIIEIDEMDGFDRARATKVNSFLTQHTDTYRRAWGPAPESFPRRCIFAATTNESDWLKDYTGGRRFWPIACRSINVEALRYFRDQLWAEAVVAYRSNVAYWITSPEESRLAAAVVADRLEQDPWTNDVAAHLTYHSTPLVAISALMRALGLETERRNPHDSTRIAKILRALHWEPVRCDVLESVTDPNPAGKSQRLRLWLRPHTPCPPDPVPRSQVMI